MNLQEFKEEVLNHYMDEENMVTVGRDVKPKWSSGNGLLQSSTYYIILGLNHFFDAKDVTRFWNMVDRCWYVSATKSLPPIRIAGLLCRNQGRQDAEAQDDYIGVMAASAMLGTPQGSLIYSYGKEHNYCYDNQNPDKWSLGFYHGRFGLIGYYAICAGVSPSFFQKMILNGLLRNGTRSSTSDDILMWIQYVMIKRSGIMPEACKCYEASFNKKYQRLGQLFEPYYGSAHPFSQISSISGVFQ